MCWYQKNKSTVHSVCPVYTNFLTSTNNIFHVLQLYYVGIGIALLERIRHQALVAVGDFTNCRPVHSRDTTLEGFIKRRRFDSQLQVTFCVCQWHAKGFSGAKLIMCICSMNYFPRCINKALWYITSVHQASSLQEWRMLQNHTCSRYTLCSCSRVHLAEVSSIWCNMIRPRMRSRRKTAITQRVGTWQILRHTWNGWHRLF